jgi:hypothetical protein
MGVHDVKKSDDQGGIGGLMSSKDVALLYSYTTVPPVPQPLQVGQDHLHLFVKLTWAQTQQEKNNKKKLSPAC